MRWNKSREQSCYRVVSCSVLAGNVMLDAAMSSCDWLMEWLSCFPKSVWSKPFKERSFGSEVNSLVSRNNVLYFILLSFLYSFRRKISRYALSEKNGIRFISRHRIIKKDKLSLKFLSFVAFSIIREKVIKFA